MAGVTMEADGPGPWGALRRPPWLTLPQGLLGGSFQEETGVWDLRSEGLHSGVTQWDLIKLCDWSDIVCESELPQWQ